MLFPDTNRIIGEAFENGCLPTMVYINKQNYERKTVQRPLHRHNSICELLLVYKGTGTYHVEGKSFPLKEGDVIFYNQGDLHEVVSATENEIGHYCIGITNLRKRGFERNYLVNTEEACVRQSRHLFPMLQTICNQMFELEGTNEEGKLAAQLLCATLIIITSQLDHFPMVAAAKTQEDWIVLRIRNYLNQNFTDDVTLDAIADALGCSSTYVSHVFKKNTGRTPIQYLIRRRIGHAQTLLISTDYTATQIATSVGYDNANYFCTLFSKIVGMSPIRYRDFYKEEMKGRLNQS